MQPESAGKVNVNARRRGPGHQGAAVRVFWVDSRSMTVHKTGGCEPHEDMNVGYLDALETAVAQGFQICGCIKNGSNP